MDGVREEEEARRNRQSPCPNHYSPVTRRHVPLPGIVQRSMKAIPHCGRLAYRTRPVNDASNCITGTAWLPPASALA
jgi:hypothetical protein